MLESSRRLVNPVPVEAPQLGMAVMVFSIVATLLLLAFQRHVVRRTGSTAISADALASARAALAAAPEVAPR